MNVIFRLGGPTFSGDTDRHIVAAQHQADSSQTKECENSIEDSAVWLKVHNNIIERHQLADLIQQLDGCN